MASGSIPPGGQRTSDAPPRPSLDGRSSLGKYEIVRELGAGGMGTVYLAVDSQLKRTVALKVLPKERTENETLVRRFEAEAQSAAQLKHENIVTIYDAGRIDGYLFIALEFVEGTDIYDLVARRGPLPLKRSINFVKQVANALEHLHKRGFVHRDIKPSNILVTREGMVKLTDMGLARAVDESLKSNITREGTTVGTVDYMAPEQARDSQSADIRSDIYSLGCTWYQMLTGEPPFPTGSVTNKLYSHISKPRPDPRSLNRSVPEEVVAVLHRMMARKPADRHQTPAEVLQEIENLGAGNKRIEELLSGDTEDDSPIAATPAYGTPLTLPPRHLPNRSDDSGRHAQKGANEQTPRPNRLPARRGRGQADPSSTPQTPPPQRLPGRQVKSGADPTPTPRSPARQAPEAQDDSVSRSRIRDGRVKPVPEEPEPTGRTPARGRAENSVPTNRDSVASNKDPAASNSDDASSNSDHVAPNRDHAASNRDHHVESNKDIVRSSKGRPASQKDNVTSRRNRITWNKESETSSADNATSNVDWKPFAVKAASIVGGVLLLGACVWLGISWRNSAAGRGNEGATKSPFTAQAANLPEDAEKEESAKKPQEKPSKSDGKAKALNKNPGLPVSFKKGANDSKPFDTSTVLGRPDERKNFPAWIPELWNPNAPPGAAANGLKTITVGRVGNDRADSPSLTAAIEQLPEQGGIIQLRGPGPFILPATKIANRRRLIIAGAKAKSSPSNGTSAADAKLGAENENAPLIVLVPGPGPATDSGLLAIETSLTFYGVHLAAFADQFPGDGPLRLIDARSGDLTVQKCSLTLVGGRSGSTIAFAVSNPLARSGAERPSRILLDRTFLRGKDLTALDADLRSVDLLAINSLFVTGRAPVLNLSAGTGTIDKTAAGTGAPRTLRFFSCTTCTEDQAVSLSLSGSGANPPGTRFQVMNSVFGAVFQPQGVAMIAINNWPSRPITATNHVAFENLAWTTESFVARGWQNLVQSNTSAPLATKEAGTWGVYWGEARSSVDYEPASFPETPEIAASDPGQFKWDGTAGRPSGPGDSGPPGCDVGLLAVTSPEAIGRADAYSRRPKVPVTPATRVADDSTVKEINLDNPRRDLENLARLINRTDWKSGTRFLVRGTNKKSCGPIHVTNKSLSIEFVDPTPPLLTFEDARGDSREHPAFISVVGGTIEIIHANFRVGSVAKHLPRWLLDVKEGSFAIRDSSLEGPSFEKPGYEGLIHFSSTRSAASPAKSEQTFYGEIQNSFIRTGKNALSGDLVSRNLIVENSVLAANGRVFDLRITSASSVPPALDLKACTLAAGEEYFHFETNFSSDAGKKATSRVRVFAEDTVFAPPLETNGKSGDKPVLIGGLPQTLIADAVAWWEYACAYSNLIGLPKSERPGGSRSDRLAEWRQVAGPAHIVRSVANANAVLLPRDLPPAKDLVQGDFRLKNEAEAATWSDTGTPIGANLAAQPVPPPVSSPAPKAKASAGRKSAPAKKTVPTPQSGF